MNTKLIIENTKKEGKRDIIGGIIWIVVSVLLFIVLPIAIGADELVICLVFGSILVLFGVLFLLVGIKRIRITEEDLDKTLNKTIGKRKPVYRYEGPLNNDVKRRDELIFGEYDPRDYQGGVKKFYTLSVPTLKILLEEGFADPETDQNGSPTIKEMLAFSEKWNSKYEFGGYVVEIGRADYRVSIDAIHRSDLEDLTEEERKAFIEFVGDVDECDENELSAWWD